jgi:hypothetical protein
VATNPRVLTQRHHTKHSPTPAECLHRQGLGKFRGVESKYENLPFFEGEHDMICGDVELLS